MKKSARTRLSEERKRRRLSQQEVADRIGTTQRNVSRWESGATTPGPYFRAKLCELFAKRSQDLDWLINQDSDEQQSDYTHSVPHTSSFVFDQQARLWHIPYRRNPFFTGREHILCRLFEALARNHSIVLSGLGGIGKTQTAIEYIYRYASEYAAIFWISAETTESMIASFMSIATLLNLPESLKQEPSHVVAAVIRWLNSHTHWLLVFDDVEAIEMVKAFLPTACGGSLLFTTRKQAPGIVAQVLNLEKMPAEEGLRFLLHRSKLLEPDTSLRHLPPADETAARAIVAALDGLPLALDQAGAYIEATHCSLADYLYLLQSAPLRLLDERDAHADHPLSVSQTFTAAFQQLAHRNASAAELLTVCTFLDPEFIPEAFFLKEASALGATFVRLASDPFQFHAAIKDLLMASLLQRDSVTRTMTMHRLVQVVIRESMLEPERVQWTRRITAALARDVSQKQAHVAGLGNGERALPSSADSSVMSDRD